MTADALGRAVVGVTEEEVFTAYVGEHLPRLRRLAYLMCGDEHRADDVVQIAITRLFTHWRKARAARDLDAYVRTIVVRTFLNEHRRRWSLVRLVGRPAELPREPSAPPPDVETREVVWSALRRLPPPARAVLVLRFVADLPVAEVATTLGCSESSVKNRTAQGLLALRRLLGGAGR
ncbi:RNA polymerase sigma-70 factor (sigma-E family) [Saccharothrix tamanrassetensis]|uniref:RNA polymerase sigma-70 factor (Sigma-E family) n=1 Tax=Saccharothrix tamanrassetensis TaxID=1051531 RepID=A0A841CMA1_9PSEU|nr:SigE family RNA polymerase sigma factor [Saccharothrix tamanrassetensis]MBB5958063.1 RNA polymerase sigma-70 factor (sigma-E family) [Saccharothrix tamanrassetensis]